MVCSALYDAKTIDPDISDPQSTSYFYCILEGGSEVGYYDAGLEGLYVGLVQPQELRRSPTMA